MSQHTYNPNIHASVVSNVRRQYDVGPEYSNQMVMDAWDQVSITDYQTGDDDARREKLRHEDIHDLLWAMIHPAA